MKIMVGGTFSPLHDGHKKLISRSFELAGKNGHVIIGLSTDTFAGGKIHPIAPYEERKEGLIAFIRESGYSATWNVISLNDRYGATLDTDFDALVVSEETFPVSLEINRLRKERGRKKVDIHQITCVLADDGRWISSTRIHRGEIDDHGRMIR
ncbi:phosphopantetheine adenylyltransferase [Methanogenium sp. MK-MG]|uniref:phosphopantetheine adenylyltransferase n=1 Tax=Methanogenium sp. MK-MG TaxID=2599926 RepID=UPI0013EA67C8|nr:phosphopantetheine adenylyltransferase [Methanogenium sp. MK-MG]KAF1078808.1 Phosphopantetheine adenylyltransferase [Methanogenium sp. MK-MG]